MAEPADWTSPNFRSNVVEQLEEAKRISQSTIVTTKSSAEMEELVFQKARSKEEYVSYVNRIIKSVKTGKKGVAQVDQQQRKQHLQQQQQQRMGQMAAAGMSHQQLDQDPINALQHLAGQRGQAMPTHNMGMMQQQMQGMVNPQQQQQQQQPPQMEMMRPPHMQARGPQMQNMQHRPQLQRQDGFMVTSAQTMPGIPGQALPASAVNQMSYQGPGGPSRAIGGPMMPGQYVQNRDPNMVPMQMQQVPGQGSPLPSMMPSPVPSHTGMMPSPVGPQQQRAQMGVPSPSQMLHTPGTAVSEPSPVPPNTSQEEQEYMNKLNSLSHYIEPLRKFVQDLEKKTDEESIKNHKKFKGLLDVLSDPKKRVKMAVLERCERVLAKLANTQPPSVNVHMCQPLLDMVAQFSAASYLNHSLYRTFGPAHEAYTGPAIRAPPQASRKRKAETVESPEELPDLIQGEIARLGTRFQISVDPRYHPGCHSYNLVCRLEEVQLPSVPPLLVKLPKSYPRSSPQCYPHNCAGYDATEFFQTVAANLDVHLSNMPSRFCLTQLLRAWEMSVRKACDPVSPLISQPNPIFV